MKFLAQLLLILAFLSPLSLTKELHITVTKSFHNHVSVRIPGTTTSTTTTTTTGTTTGTTAGNEEVAVEETPAEEAAVEETVVEEAPVEEAPAEEAPVEEAPAEEAPVEEAPAEEAVVEETVNEEASATEESSGQEAEAPIIPGAEAFNVCDPNDRPPACTADFNPVCGYINECEGGACTATFSNGCDACSNSTVNGYVNGSCEDAETACDPDNRPVACPLIFTATCAVASDCQGPFCFANTSNSCEACSQLGVGYSLPGICPGPDLSGEQQNCDPDNRPANCPADFNPVCAHLNNCVGANCWSTAGNACSACADRNVDAYIAGACPETGSNEG